jgi:hypothetical protein
MFYDDNPLSNLLTIGMFGLSYFCGHQSGKTAAIFEMEGRQKDAELQALRRQVDELSKRLTPQGK